MTASGTPPVAWTPPPVPTLVPPPAGTERAELVENVREALKVLPAHFQSKTFIEGLEAGDLFSLNSMLGGGIEVQVVAALNKLRDLWDPDEHWSEYSFVRSSQTFPDVRLRTDSDRLKLAGAETVLGVELKGWYLLSREMQPSFRYTVNEAACDPHDLVAVYPWHLTNVLSGYPQIYRPWVESARYAAVLRNHYWTVERRAKEIEDHNTRLAEITAWNVNRKGKKPTAPGPLHDARYFDVEPPANLSTVAPYPSPKDKISDKGVSDSGGNFGRLGRSKLLMADYIDEMLETSVSGIQAKHWTQFFRAYAEGAQKNDLDDKITRMVTKFAKDSGLLSTDIEDLLNAWIARLSNTE